MLMRALGKKRQRKKLQRARRHMRRAKGVRMDLKDLRFFIAVYETKGFSRASDFLGTVQSNVSTRILRLERALGVQLFERKWRSLVPTASGDELYEDAKQVIAALNQKIGRASRRE